MHLPLVVPPHFRIIAHRGASAYRPENSLAAFQLAAEMGVTEVETDAQLTTDDQVVLCHDTTLARYGYGDQPVEAMAWPDLAALDMGSWFSPHLFAGEKMITLDTLFETHQSHFTYHIELKGKAPTLARRVHQTIITHQMIDQVIITSFSYEMLIAMRQIDPTIRLAWLFRDLIDDVWPKAEALALFQLCPLAENASARWVKKAHSVVPEVRVWGMQGTPIEVRARIAKVVEAGCDGMTIDWPDWASKVSTNKQAKNQE